MIDTFAHLSFPEKKQKLLTLTQEGGDIFQYISSLPEGSDNALIDIYTSMITGANKIHADQDIIHQIDTGTRELLTYQNDADKLQNEKEAEDLLTQL